MTLRRPANVPAAMRVACVLSLLGISEFQVSRDAVVFHHRVGIAFSRQAKGFAERDQRVSLKRDQRKFRHRSATSQITGASSVNQREIAWQKVAGRGVHIAPTAAPFAAVRKSSLHEPALASQPSGEPVHGLPRAWGRLEGGVTSLRHPCVSRGLAELKHFRSTKPPNGASSGIGENVSPPGY